jgi:hypothetical protein
MPAYFQPTAPAPANNSYWRPNALSNPNIPYPASPYAGPPGGGTVRRGGNGMGNWLAMRNNLAARNLAAQTPNPSAAFGVNVGDFGGSGIAGGTVKKGDFGGAFAPNTTFNGGGISGAGGGGGMAGLAAVEAWQAAAQAITY